MHPEPNISDLRLATNHFKMLVKVIIILTISISISAGDIIPKNIQEPKPSQAISSVNFHRDDVPMAYKYSSYHPRSKNYLKYENYLPHDQQNTPSSTNYRSIQYAPLIEPGQLHQVDNVKFGKFASQHNSQELLNPAKSKTEEIPTANKDKKHLEPRFEELPAAIGVLRQANHLSHLDYLPGHNIEVLRSINRSPGHNAVYRSYTDRNQSADKQRNVNVLNKYLIYPPSRDSEYYTKSTEMSTQADPGTTPTSTISDSTTTTTTTTTTTPTLQPYLVPYIQHPRQYIVQKPITYLVEKPITADKTPYTKMHALLLNVARSYNFGMAPHKSLHAGASPSLLGKIHSHHPLLKIPGSKELHVPLSEQKTILYPVQKNLHFAIHS